MAAAVSPAGGAHHSVAEVEAHNHLLEDPPRLVLCQPVVQAALTQEAVQLRAGGEREGAGRQAGGRMCRWATGVQQRRRQEEGGLEDAHITRWSSTVGAAGGGRPIPELPH